MEDLIKALTNRDLKTVSRDTGIPYDRMYKWTKGKSKPKTEDYEILQDYLLNGNSSINQPDVREPDGRIVTSRILKTQTKGLIPFFSADFMAGRSVVNYDDGTQHPEYYMDIPEFAGCVAFRAFGDSMENIIKSSSVLFGYKLDEDWRTSIDYGQIYGIVMRNGLRYLKYIRKSKEDDKNMFLLKSENEKYDDFEVSKDKIKNIWLIQGWIDKRA